MKSTNSLYFLCGIALAFTQATVLSTTVSFGQTSPSLIQAALNQNSEAKKQDPKAYLFEVTVQVDPNQTVWTVDNVYTKNASPSDNLNYLSGLASGDNLFMDKQAYNTFPCGPVNNHKCGKPTGIPEAAELHPALAHWKMDLKQIKKTVAGVTFDTDIKLNIEVSTVKRLRTFGFLPAIRDEDQNQLTQSLAALPDTMTAITLSDNWGANHKSDYLILDASSGKVLARGKYAKRPPRAGSVSSGG